MAAVLVPSTRVLKRVCTTFKFCHLNVSTSQILRYRISVFEFPLLYLNRSVRINVLTKSICMYRLH